MLFLSSRRRSREERNGFVKEVYVVKYQGEVSVCLRVFAGSFALKPFRDYSLCSVCILPQPAFYNQSAVCIVHLVCVLPLVCSLQSAVCVLHWPLENHRKELFSRELHWEIFCCIISYSQLKEAWSRDIARIEDGGERCTRCTLFWIGLVFH